MDLGSNALERQGTADQGEVSRGKGPRTESDRWRRRIRMGESSSGTKGMVLKGVDYGPTVEGPVPRSEPRSLGE